MLKKTCCDCKVESLLTGKRREEDCATHPRPGEESARELAVKCRHPDPQSYPLAPDHAQSPHMPFIETEVEHPIKVTANKAHQEK